MQNTTAKLIFKAKKCDHVTGFLKELHSSPSPERIIFKVLLLTYKAHPDEGPVYLKDLLNATYLRDLAAPQTNSFLKSPQQDLKGLLRVDLKKLNSQKY